MNETTADLPVAGGSLRAGVWGSDGPLVIAAHGITSQHRAWALLGPDLGRDHRFVALDLRGRGHSRDLPGPYGLAAHAADVAAVAAHLGGPAVLLGHSMGGMVLAAAARRGAAARLVLVDGGPLLPPPPGLGPDAGDTEIAAAVAAAVGPAFARLSTTYATPQEYLQFWRRHPSMHPWNEAMASFVSYDLVPADGAGAEGFWQPACRLAAAERDALDLYALTGDGAPEQPLGVPAVFLRAERGRLDEPDRPCYPAGYATGRLPGVVEHTVPGTNHYTIVLGPTGAAAVAAAVRAG